MKLVLRRDQKSSGMLSKAVTFTLDVRADLSDQERDWITKYKMGDTILYEKYEMMDRGSGLLGLASRIGYSALNTKLTVDSLAKGKHFECKDIIEMRALEEQVKEAASNFKAILDTAAQFGGEEVVEI